VFASDSDLDARNADRSCQFDHVPDADLRAKRDEPVDAEVASASESVADADDSRSRIGHGAAGGGESKCVFGWWSSEPDVGRVAHGVAARVDRLTAIGNGQVPDVAALAWKTLLARADVTRRDP
jgi:hypothetical protein